jgi:hypothetical protein
VSFRIVADVLDYSQSTLGTRLVLIAIAECADDERREAWPSVELLMRKARLSEAAVHRALRALARLGELEVLPRPGRSNLYSIPDLTQGGANLTGVSLAIPLSPATPGGVSSDTPGVSLATPRTIKGTVTEPSLARRASRTRPDSETLTPERLEFAKSLGLTQKQAEDEWAKMGDHEFATPRRDWTKVWRNWCRTAKPRYQAVGAYAGNGRQQPGRAPVPGVEETQELLKRLYG